MPTYRKKRKFGRKPVRARYGRKPFRRYGRKYSVRSRGRSLSAFSGGAASIPPVIVSNVSAAAGLKKVRMESRKVMDEVKEGLNDAKDYYRVLAPIVSPLAEYFGLSQGQAIAAMGIGALGSAVAPSVMPTIKSYLKPPSAPTRVPPVIVSKIALDAEKPKRTVHTLGFDGWSAHEL